MEDGEKLGLEVRESILDLLSRYSTLCTVLNELDSIRDNVQEQVVEAIEEARRLYRESGMKDRNLEAKLHVD